MDFIAEFGFDVKEGKAHEFQKWLSENESKIAAACPTGVEYVGTFGVIYSSEKHAGGIASSSGWRATAHRTRWRQR
jgi:hypothetical protein